MTSTDPIPYRDLAVDPETDAEIAVHELDAEFDRQLIRSQGALPFLGRSTTRIELLATWAFMVAAVVLGVFAFYLQSNKVDKETRERVASNRELILQLEDSVQYTCDAIEGIKDSLRGLITVDLVEIGASASTAKNLGERLEARLQEVTPPIDCSP